MKFVGEIGIPRREYLFELDYVDIVQIERGYERRQRHRWSATRWQTFCLMNAFAGGDAMKKNGIHTPQDLIHFPWDTAADDDDDGTTSGGGITEKEAERLRELMRRENAARAAAAEG
jgi:hypothetical protein